MKSFNFIIFGSVREDKKLSSFYSEEELKEIGLKKFGKNVLISRKASIYSPGEIEIADNVRIDDFCVLSGKMSIGSNIHISVYTGLFGGKSGICLSDFTTISSKCMLYADSDDYSGEYMTNPMLPDKYTNVTGGRICMKEYSILGTGCTVLPGVTIGEGVAVGAMSLVIKDLEEWGIYVGIPCKFLKARKKGLLDLKEKYMKQEI